MTLKTTKFDPADYIDTIEEARDFLKFSMGDHCTAEHALRSIAIACRSAGGDALSPRDIAGYIHAYFCNQA